MSERRTLRFGEWKSPVSTDLISSASISIIDLKYDGTDLYYTEMRPTEAGRQVIVRLDNSSKTSDVTPAPFQSRTRVHEYGGGAFTVKDGTVYFSNFSDQKLYRQTKNSAPQAITRENKVRFSDGVVNRTSS